MYCYQNILTDTGHTCILHVKMTAQNYTTAAATTTNDNNNLNNNNNSCFILTG